MKARASGSFRRGDVVRISGDSVGGSWSRDLVLAIEAQSSGVAALWARARIADLLYDARRGADADETRSAIVATALTPHLVSKYTSLVAVDKTPVRPAGEPLTNEQVASRIPYGQSGSAIFGFPATATNAANLQLSGLAARLAALLLFRAPLLRRRASGGSAY